MKPLDDAKKAQALVYRLLGGASEATITTEEQQFLRVWMVARVNEQEEKSRQSDVQAAAKKGWDDAMGGSKA